MSDLAVLNVTHAGLSHDLSSPVHIDTSDADIRRIAAEDRGVPSDVFANYVVDRLASAEGVPKFYLRPKVPFGADAVTRKRETVIESVKEVALRAGGHSAELTGVLLDLFSDPTSEENAHSGTRVQNAVERLEDTLQELKGELAALALLNAVIG